MPPAPSSSPITVAGLEYSAIPINHSDPDSNNLYVRTDVVKELGGSLRSGEAVVVLGPPGSGKTELARSILMRAKLDAFHQMEFGGVVAGDQLDGITTLEGSGTKFYPSEHLKAVRAAASGKRVGYVPDEMNRASMFGINKMLRLYAQWEYVSDLDGVLEVSPKNLLTVGTMNIGFGFSGTNQVDEAIADRFKPLILELPPSEIVARILNERFDGIDSDTVKSICQIYKASHESEDIYSLGIRDVLRLGNSVHNIGTNLIKAVELIIGGSAHLRRLPPEATEAVIAIAKSVTK